MVINITLSVTEMIQCRGASMVSVEVKNLRAGVLRGVKAFFPSGKLSIVLGPNGAGKTTLLRAIAGLIEYEGTILFNGESIDSLKPYERGAALVPQSNSLFKCMSVYDNIAFGLRVRGVPEDVVREKVRRIAEMLRITSLLNRYPASLSGGEAKKVALARALIVEPRIVMLDEPFEPLDAESRIIVEQDMMMAIRKTRRTTILVTHEIEKAASLAENLLLLWEGKNLYCGPPSGLDPSTLPSESLFWLGTILEADEVDCEGGMYYARIGSLRMPVYNLEHPPRGRIKILIPSNRVRVCKRGSLMGDVVRRDNKNSFCRAVIDVGGAEINVITPVNLSVGEKVRLRISGCLALNDGRETRG